MSIYQHGDIGAVPSHSILGKLNQAIFWPHTDLYHFFIIADHIPEEDDYVILESTGKGISVGRLSWYKGKGYRVFRVEPAEYHETVIKHRGVQACRRLTKHGQAKYDYWLYMKLLVGCIAVWDRHLTDKIRRRRSPFPWWVIKPSELLYARDSRFICTEAANEAWRMVDLPIIPDGIIKLPAGFIMALYNKFLVEVLSDGTIVSVSLTDIGHSQD
jgi:hypothetical protein